MKTYPLWLHGYKKNKIKDEDMKNIRNYKT